MHDVFLDVFMREHSLIVEPRYPTIRYYTNFFTHVKIRKQQQQQHSTQTILQSQIL